MSRSRAGKPVFRLHLAHPQFFVEREGVAEPPIAVDAPDRDRRLAALGQRVRAERGRLVAVLPEGEVWRARIAGRPTASRVRAAATAALGTDRVAFVQGPEGREGRAVAALRRTTLAETRAFLGRAGLRPDAVTGAGEFPGFASAPEFGAHAFRLPRPSAPVAAGLATAAALLLTLASQPEPRRELPAPEIASLAPEAVPVMPPDPVIEQARLIEPILPRPRPEGFVAVPARPPALPPAIQTAVLQPAAAVAFAARNLPPEVRAAVAGPGPAQPDPRVAVLLADGTAPVPRKRPGSDSRQAALPAANDAAPVAVPPVAAPSAAAPAAGQAATGIAPRPRPAPARQAATTSDPAPTPVAMRTGGPLPRPATRESHDALLAAAIGAAVADAQASAPAPVRVAALAPVSDALPAALAAPVVAVPAVAPPEKRPLVRAPAPARPAAPAQPTRSVTAAAPVQSLRVAAVAPQPVRTVTPQPVRTLAPAAVKPVVTARPAATPVRQTVRQASLQPSASAPRAVQPAASTQRAPQKTTPQQTTRQEPARPGSVTLIGVFGKPDQRHALVRVGNGSTQRVRAGDRIGGVQVAAIGADSVRLAGGGRETVLRLPE